MRTMPRANPMRDQAESEITPTPGSGSSAWESAREEAGECTRRRSPEQTLERTDPMRATRPTGGRPAGSSAQATESEDSSRTGPEREGTAMVAEGSHPGGSGGGSLRARTSTRTVELWPGALGSGRGRPQRRTPGALRGDLGVEILLARQSEEQSVKGVETSQTQRAGVGSPAQSGVRRTFARRLCCGRFARPGRAEGDPNPMRGGCALWNDLGGVPERTPASLPGRRAVASRSVRRVAPTAAGHVLKGMVSEESWKNRRARACAPCACQDPRAALRGPVADGRRCTLRLEPMRDAARRGSSGRRP
jgi:hypothetical protein